jgi:hypothetical protein
MGSRKSSWAQRYSSYLLGSDGKEVGSFLPVHFALVYEFEIRFMNQGTRLQCGSGSLAAYLAQLQSAQFAVNQRRELVNAYTATLAGA